MIQRFTGQRFGRLVAVEPTRQRVRGAVVWRCRCDCGREVLVESRKLSSGAVRSCGCTPPDYDGRKDLTGQRFGRLTVLGQSDHRTKSRNALWRCQCDCGNEIETTKARLISGGAASCGCGRKPPLKNWVGKRFGRAVVQEYAGKENGHQLWRCRCDCGQVFVANQSNLQDGQTVSCGCRRREQPGLHFVDGTLVEGIQSKKRSRANTSGVRGVYFNKKRGKWIAQIMFKGRCYYLGGYDKLEDAAKARAKGEEMFDDFLAWYQREYGQEEQKACRAELPQPKQSGGK